MFWSIIYIFAVLTANYTATWFIPLPMGLLSFGIVLFGITFTARDYVHQLGRNHVYTMIVVSILGSASLCILVGVNWRIVIASTIGISIAETLDTEIYQRLLKRSWAVRVLTSNLVSVPTDTILFNTLAFLFVFPIPILAQITIGETVVKYLVGLLTASFRAISVYTYGSNPKNKSD